MELTQNILEHIDTLASEQLELLKTLAQIPAPSGKEALRAEFCRDWLHKNGASDAYIDEALNVILPIGVTGNCPLVVFAAHSDVVFPDTAPLPLRTEDEKLCCPGVGDDTACVTALLMTARYIVQNALTPKDCGILIVVDSGEEGLGNLKGIRQVFSDYADRIREFIAFDGQSCRCVNKAVGSKRYQVEIDTEGGHSYSAFGNKNAIAYLAAMIAKLYEIQIPKQGKTTYNVGTVSGGTSVNTIAQHAEMLYEYRSDDRGSLGIMEEKFWAVIETFRDMGIRVNVTTVGDRPCSGDVDAGRMAALQERAAEATLRHHGRELLFASGSTDCNIPLSLGVPAICVGCYEGKGSHTREEYIYIDSLLPGMKFAFDMILGYFEQRKAR